MTRRCLLEHKPCRIREGRLLPFGFGVVSVRVSTPRIWAQVACEKRARLCRFTMFAPTDSTQLRNLTDMVAELSSMVTADTEVATGLMHRNTKLLVEVQDGIARQVLSLEAVQGKCQGRFLEDGHTSWWSCSVQEQPSRGETPEGDAGPYIEVQTNINREEVVKHAMKEIEVVFWDQRTDPFEDEKDCVEALLEVDPLGEFDQE